MLEWRSEEHGNEAEESWSSLSESGREEARRAAAKAMQLLLHRQRTEKELRQKLAEKEFSQEGIDAAVAYVSSFGYLNDRRYAEVYIHSMQGKKSLSLIRRELLEKGVSEQDADDVMEEVYSDEEEEVYSLIGKKCGAPHKLGEAELRRTVLYLCRRGYRMSLCWKQIRRYEQEAQL